MAARRASTTGRSGQHGVLGRPVEDLFVVFMTQLFRRSPTRSGPSCGHSSIRPSTIDRRTSGSTGAGRRDRRPPLRRTRNLRPASDRRRGGHVGHRGRRHPFDAGTAIGRAPVSGRRRCARRRGCCARTTRAGRAPFELTQVVDAGDLACTPFSAEEAVGQIEAARVLSSRTGPARRGGRRPHGGPAAPSGHGGSPRAARPGALRRAPRHVGHLFRPALHSRHPVPPGLGGGLLLRDHSVHVGLRGPLYARST